MRRHRSKLKSLEDLLPKVTKNMGIDSRLKELMIMNYWPEIAKGKIGLDSKPHSIKRTQKGLILCIAVKTAMVAQELNMIKMVLLDKINIIASQVGLKVVDIFISPKYWDEMLEDEINNKTNAAFYSNLKEESTFDINSIGLSKEQKDFIEETLKMLDFDNTIKDRLRRVMQNDIKLKNYKEQKGFSVCRSCGVVLRSADDEICPSCFFN